MDGEYLMGDFRNNNVFMLVLNTQMRMEVQPKVFI